MNEFVIEIVILSVFFLMFLLPIVILLIEGVKKRFSFGVVLFMSLCLVAVALAATGIIHSFKSGVEIEYKATVTDFNEVYNNGYEIINQEGKIYTLKKQQ